jgi:S-formylglutathione hydrolase
VGTRRLAIALVLLLTTVAAARQPAARPAGEVVIHSIAVDALKNNLLGDPAQRNVAVYLPPTYKTSATRRYPTVYLLHGYLSNLQAFGKREGIPGYQGMQLATLMDGLIATGTSKEMIVVVPDGRNAYFGSFYTNSPVTGGWEDFVARELVRWVDGNFRTIAAAESRGIAGHSMGGYGAIMLGMKHPDVFGAFYALSPCCVGLEGDLGPENQAWVAAAQVRTRNQLQPRPQSPEEFYTSAFIALSAAFSPNPAKPELYIDLPFEPNDGRMVPKDAIIAAWRSKMPLYLVDEYRQNLERLRGIYLDYGAREEFSHIRTTTRAFSAELANRGIAHTFEVYPDGNHENTIRERLEARVFRFFSEVLRVP